MLGYKFCLNSKRGYFGSIISSGFSLLVSEVGTKTPTLTIL